MLSKSKKLIMPLLFTLVGGLVGYIYYKFWGCYGTWSISSNAVSSSIYGGIIGGLISVLFSKN